MMKRVITRTETKYKEARRCSRFLFVPFWNPSTENSPPIVDSWIDFDPMNENVLEFVPRIISVVEDRSKFWETTMLISDRVDDVERGREGWSDRGSATGRHA